MYWLETTPTTVSGSSSWFLTALAGGPETTMLPEVALKSMVDDSAAAGVLKPRALTVRSVRRTSSAESELGSRPAMTVIPGDELRGGSDTSAPVGWSTASVEAPLTANVPLIATWPHAARTCWSLPRVATVPVLNPGLTSPDGYTATWCSWLRASAGEASADWRPPARATISVIAAIPMATPVVVSDVRSGRRPVPRSPTFSVSRQ